MGLHESQSKFINNLKSSGASVRTLAEITPYLDEICAEAEATFKSLPEAEIKQLRDRVTIELNHPSELSKYSQIPNSQTPISDIEP
jgi:Zn-dependent M32 family carboxypeptidase